MRNALILAAVSAALAGCAGSVDVAVNPPPTPAPPPVSTPAAPPPVPPPVVDESAALQALLDKGGVVQLDARTYHVTQTLTMRVSGTTLQGHGSATVIEFVPPLKGGNVRCGNDRVITSPCSTGGPPAPIAAPIAIGATSFEVVNLADVSSLVPGDWLLLGDYDSKILDAKTHEAYATTADWMQVASISGTTVTVTTPFRTAYRAQPYVPAFSGSYFQRLLPAANLTIQDLSIVVNDSNGGAALGLCMLTTLNPTFRHISVTSHNANAIYMEHTKGATFDGDTITNGLVLNEFASAVDLTIENSTFISGGQAIGLDLGTGFFHIVNNTIAKSANVAIYALYNVHDGVISGNTVDYVDIAGATPRALGLYLMGSPRISITGNTLLGGGGSPSVGLYIASNASDADETDAGDVASGNTIQGFTITQAGP